MIGAGVRVVRRVEVRIGSSGLLDMSLLRRVGADIRPGDDVELVVRGRLNDGQPALADWLGQVLAQCRQIHVRAHGPGLAMFRAALVESIERTAASG